MANKRVDMHRLQEMVGQHRMGTGPREVAKLLEMSPNTERRYKEALMVGTAFAGQPDNFYLSLKQFYDSAPASGWRAETHQER